VTPSDDITPASAAVGLGFELALILIGLALIWIFVLRRRARESRVRLLEPWGLPAVDFAYFLCFAFVGAATLSALAGWYFRHRRLSSDAELVVGGAVMHGGALVGIAGFFLVYGQRAYRAVGGWPLGQIVKSGVVTFLISVPLVDGTSVAWEYLLTKTGLPNEKQALVDILQNGHSSTLAALLVVVAVFIVPFTEEMVFRGGLFRYFRTRVPRWTAILLTSALFGALHVSWGGHYEGLPSLAPLIVLAVVFCLAYERTGLVGTAIVAHALFNLKEFILLLAGVAS
jgi:membrane protease YdiL (CAAX protease family)